jgi:hypothetical protein
MTTHTVIQKRNVMATNIDSLNRHAYYTSDLDNGSVFKLDTIQDLTSGCEVWTVTKSNGSSADFWMAANTDVNMLVSGTKQYRGLSVDPRDNYVSACTVFDAFKPQVGDVILLTADAFTGAVSTNTYANSVDNGTDLVWGTAKTASALSLKLVDTTYIAIPDGSLGDTQQVAAYKLVCIANPTAQ